MYCYTVSLGSGKTEIYIHLINQQLQKIKRFFIYYQKLLLLLRLFNDCNPILEKEWVYIIQDLIFPNGQNYGMR